MGKPMKSQLATVLLSASLLLTGCVTTENRPNSADSSQNVGFLSDYSKLQAVPDRAGLLRHVDRSVDVRSYNKLFIEPVQIFIATDGEAYKGLEPQTMARLAETFQGAFSRAVVPAYQFVPAPGSGVLHIRLAITGIQSVNTPYGVTDFLPIKAVYNAGRAAAGAAPKLAEMSAELEVLDANGRQVLAAVATRKSDSTLSQAERITWNDLSPIVDVWARQFRQGLDNLRGLNSPAAP
jgi:hypothetical protein